MKGLKILFGFITLAAAANFLYTFHTLDIHACIGWFAATVLSMLFFLAVLILDHDKVSLGDKNY